MKNFVIALAALFLCASAKSQQSLIKVNGWNAYVHLPSSYASSPTKTYPTILFFPGIGEVGINAGSVIINGPGAYITQGWNGNETINGSTVEFIVISLQPSAAYPNEILMNTAIQSLKSLYRINTKQLYLTGLSHGGWCATTFVTGDAYGGPYTYASQVAAVVTVEGMRPDDNAPYPNLFDNFAKSGGRYLGFEQINDSRDTKTVVDRMNATTANSAIYVQTNFGGGGHCCWEEFYGGNGTQPTNFTLDGTSQNIYQWLAKMTVSSGNGTLAANQAPVANAGADQTITLPTSSVTLTGTGTDADGTVASYAWTKASGPSSGTIASPSAAKTSITGLVQGTYTFTLKVTDNKGATATDNVIVTVNAAAINKAPVANAGADQTITLPTSSVTLTGTGTDADGTIAKYAWTKASGPSSGTIASSSAAKTSITGLVQGTYTFTLKVTDNKGATATDNVVVTVNAATTNKAPVANAGADQTITLPTSSVTLTGTGTDADGSIASYAWTKASGPSSGTIASPSAAKTVINSLVQGSYTFTLKVTDNKGATSTDNVVVTVNAAAAQLPTVNAGNDLTITLPTSSATLSGTASSSGKTISSYAWTETSGPSTATFSAASSATTSVSNLVKGTYTFSLKATDNSGSSATDAVNVTVNAAVTQAGCNANAPVTYIQAPTGTGEIYKVTPDPAWKGGDTIKINAANFSGVIEFDHLHGDPCRPIVIINSGGVVTTTTIRLKTDCEYVRLTGTGTKGVPYGFKISGGPVAIDYGHHIEIDHVEVTGGNLGFYIKAIPDLTIPVTVYVKGASNNYLINKIYVHNCWVHDTHGEGMYIGHTAPDGGDGQTGTYADGSSILPLRLDSVEISYNLVERTDWDGIQLSNAKDGAKIHDNIVRNFGLINMGNQQAGIILGGNTNGDVYNNYVVNGTGNGIELFGYGTINCYNNYVDSTGNDKTTTGQESIFANDIPIVSEPEPKQQIIAYGDTINHPMPKGAIRVGAYNNNSLASNVHDNKYCIPGAASNWQTFYIALNPTGSSNVNNILLCTSRTVARPEVTTDAAPAEAVQKADYNSVSLKAYPNPVTSLVNIELALSATNQPVYLTLTDIQGRTLFTKELQALQQSTSLQIDMSKYTDGVYFLNARTFFKSVTQKIVKASGH